MVGIEYALHPIIILGGARQPIAIDGTVYLSLAAAARSPTIVLRVLQASHDQPWRAAFLDAFFASEAARIVGHDPVVRGTIAREGGMTVEEFGRWNREVVR